MNYSLLFHRAYPSRYGNSLKNLEAVFKYLSIHKLCALPGDHKKISYTLTFDDATCDFYFFIYPLLKKYQLKAILAVPVSFISNISSMSKEKRMLELKKHTNLSQLHSSAFCNWQELIEMKNSQHVIMASHSMSHRNLLHLNLAETDNEFKKSKEILEEKLNGPVDTFIVPYGRIHKQSLKIAKKYYTYVYRIGSALNLSWKQKVLYRISCDGLTKPYISFKKSKKLIFLSKNIINSLRGL